MAKETVLTMVLEHVNVPPMQTWNYLHANDTSLTVPVPKSTGAVLGSAAMVRFAPLETAPARAMTAAGRCSAACICIVI